MVGGLKDNIKPADSNIDTYGQNKKLNAKDFNTMNSFKLDDEIEA
jgi:hypothetical protein